MQRQNIICFFIVLLAVTFVFSTMPAMATSTSDSLTKSSSKTNSSSKAKKTKKKSKKSSKKTKKTKKKVGKININTADAKTLTEFTGIGPVTAKKIVDYRRKNGKFKSAKDLMNVKGIGEKTLQKMKPQLKF